MKATTYLLAAGMLGSFLSLPLSAQWQQLPTQPERVATTCLASRGNWVVVENDGKLFISTDAGAYWADISDGLPTPRNLSSVIVREAHLLALEQYSSQVYRFDLVNEYWTPFVSGLPADGSNYFLRQCGNNLMLLHRNQFFDEPTIFISTDNALSWEPSAQGLHPDFKPAWLEVIENGNRAVLFGTRQSQMPFTPPTTAERPGAPPALLRTSPVK